MRLQYISGFQTDARAVQAEPVEHASVQRNFSHQAPRSIQTGKTRTFLDFQEPGFPRLPFTGDFRPQGLPRNCP